MSNERPFAISFDFETYGACEEGWHGTALPEQNFFHPQRSLLTDRVSPRDLLLTASVTIIDNAPSSPALWSPSTLASIKTGHTLVFDMNRSSHVEDLCSWLRSSHTIFGMNLLFDLLYGRCWTDIRLALDGSQCLISLDILNFLECEVRTAKSLKTLGPVLRQYSYDPEELIKHRRFPKPTWKSPKTGRGVHEYNGSDTHNCILGSSELARRILRRFGPSTPKLSPYCINFYSEAMWSCLSMAESGIPYSRPVLSSLRSNAVSTMERSSEEASCWWDLILNGEGSNKSKDAFILRVAEAVNETGVQFLAHPLLKKTDKKKSVSWSDQNRLLARVLLPDDHPLQDALALIDSNSHAQKLIGSYLDPLLTSKKKVDSKKPLKSLSSLILGDGPVQLGFPTIYIVPSQAKDNASDDEGGQQQARLSFKDPAAQTNPAEIKTAYASRFGSNGLIICKDLSQAELAGAGVLSGEPSLLSNFDKEDGDLHTERAELTFGLSSLIAKYGPNYRENKAFKKLERQACKHGNFTDLNWGSALTLRKTILKKGHTLVPMSLCQAVVADRPKVRPVLFAWQNEWVERARRTHICEMPFTGQSRSFPGIIQGNDVNEAVNFPIQAIAANTMVDIQNRLNRRLPSNRFFNSPCYMFLNCYDALYFDVRLDFAAELDARFEEAYRQVVTNGYWAMMCNHTGHHCRLRYDSDILWKASS